MNDREKLQAIARRAELEIEFHDLSDWQFPAAYPPHSYPLSALDEPESEKTARRKRTR